MLKNRLFNVFIAVALVLIIALTVREAFATTNIISRGGAANEAAILECGSLPSHFSIHTKRMQETGTQLIYSDAGPTGVDGGLVYLLSAYRTCHDLER
jgi:hypothetical protein